MKQVQINIKEQKQICFLIQVRLPQEQEPLGSKSG